MTTTPGPSRRALLRVAALVGRALLVVWVTATVVFVALRAAGPLLLGEVVAEEAIEWGADLVLTHHPLFFHPVSRMAYSNPDTAAACLLLSSLTGIPVSTTHTKTTAIMGVGASKRISSVNWGVVKEMVYAWVLTFPCCGLVGYLMVKLFLAIF